MLSTATRRRRLLRGLAAAALPWDLALAQGTPGATLPFSGVIRFLKSDMAPPVANNWGYFSDPDYDALMTRVYEAFDPAAQDRLLAELHAKVVDDALFLFIAHDLNPRAMSRRVKGFVQARSWFQDLTPISLA